MNRKRNKENYKIRQLIERQASRAVRRKKWENLQSLIACLVLFTTPAFGAPVHVELIIFANNTPERELEWFLKPKEIIKIEETIDEDEDSSLDSSPTSETSHQETISLTDLELTGPQAVQSYVLTDIAEAIVENPNFELLNYISWVQEPVPKSNTTPISLDAPLSDFFLSDELLLAGSASVYEVAQTLQFEIELSYRPVADMEISVVHLPETVKLYSPGESYLLAERRRIYINDVHYFDHPKFGVLFTIVRPQQPEYSAQ